MKSRANTAVQNEFSCNKVIYSKYTSCEEMEEHVRRYGIILPCEDTDTPENNDMRKAYWMLLNRKKLPDDLTQRLAGYKENRERSRALRIIEFLNSHYGDAALTGSAAAYFCYGCRQVPRKLEFYCKGSILPELELLSRKGWQYSITEIQNTDSMEEYSFRSESLPDIINYKSGTDTAEKINGILTADIDTVVIDLTIKADSWNERSYKDLKQLAESSRSKINESIMEMADKVLKKWEARNKKLGKKEMDA